MVQVTNRFIKTTTKLGRYPVGDCLYLNITTSGATGIARSWVVRLLIRGVRKNFGIGSVKDITLTEARIKANELRTLARRGENLRQALKPRATVTFHEVCVETHQELVPTFRNLKHTKQWLSELAPCIKAFGKIPVDEIRPADIAKALKPWWNRTPETSRRVLQRLKVIFKRCIALEHCRTDPTVGVELLLPGKRPPAKHREFLPFANVPLFMKKLEKADAGVIPSTMLQVQILCATRPSETRQALWSEFDLKQQIWTIPADRTKTGKAHRIPLSPQVLELLERAKAWKKTLGNKHGHVFPGSKAGQPISEATAGKVIRTHDYFGFRNAPNATQKKGSIRKFVPHGFRTSFRTWGADISPASPVVLEACLAHVTPGVESVYKRTDLFDKRRTVMNDWADHCLPKKR
jgi:integrase